MGPARRRRAGVGPRQLPRARQAQLDGFDLHANNALNTLLKSVQERRLDELLGGDAFITKVRDSIGSHYQQADIKRDPRAISDSGEGRGYRRRLRGRGLVAVHAHRHLGAAFVGRGRGG